MDELLENLFSVSVSSTPNSVSQPHPKYSELKRRSKVECQEKRRRELLQEQKRLRDLTFDASRDLGTAFSKTLPSRPVKQDRYRLMHSEWLVDIPNDLATKWNMFLCPEGKHVLVIAMHGRTKVMDRRRQEITNFNSMLPGGGRDNPRELSVLDCIWVPHDKTLYVLDMLCWSYHDIMDCQAEFRFFWLHCKFEENPELTDRKQNQGHKFVHLESHVCEPALIAATMSRFPPFPGGPNLDGVLFYHMEAHYTMGKNSPLVGWLKGYMVSDLLGVPVAPEYLASRPPGMCLKDHIKEEEQMMTKQRRQRRKQRRTAIIKKMECGQSSDTEEYEDMDDCWEDEAEEMVTQSVEVTSEQTVHQTYKAASADTDVETAVSSELMTT